MRKKQVFKKYSQTELNLPPLETLIPENHLSKTVNNFVDSLDNDIFDSLYKGGGTSAYHPHMLMKVLLYAYSIGLYSSRSIMTACKENIMFMWLSGLQYPDHRTVNNFRNLIKDIFPEIFDKLLIQIRTEGYVSLENFYVDGTKLEANANKYTFVWSKNVQRYKDKNKADIISMLKEIEELNLEEETSVRLKKKQNKLSKTVREKIRKYNDYLKKEEILGNRKSFSKTDTSATFMRGKDDRLLPCYNIIIGTENQFILNYSLHQKSTEPEFFIEHMEKLSNKPKAVIADAAYGSEENYEYLEKNKIKNYLKYNSYFQESKKSFKKKIFNKNNFVYNPEIDSYKCPAEKDLKYLYTRTDKNFNGYISHQKIYQCEECTSCVLSNDCKKGKGNRRIQFSERYEHFKKQAKNNLDSETGIKLRKKRNTDVETVFGNIKHNYKFRRFSLRGLEKVKLEFGLVSIAHNLRKLSRIGNMPFLLFLLSEIYSKIFRFFRNSSFEYEKRSYLNFTF